MKSSIPPIQMITIEEPDTTKLFNALQKIHSRPNTVTRQQFHQFEPLFKKEHNLDPTQLENLTKLYCKTFDFYKQTVIIESADNPKVVITLPAVFAPVRTLSPTERNATLVDINNKLAGSLPKHSTNAFGQMADALITEQVHNKSVITEYRKDYVATIQEFLNAYSDKSKPATITVDETATSTVFKDADCTFE
jgi:hypothetical protein